MHETNDYQRTDIGGYDSEHAQPKSFGSGLVQCEITLTCSCIVYVAVSFGYSSHRGRIGGTPVREACSNRVYQYGSSRYRASTAARNLK